MNKRLKHLLAIVLAVMVLSSCCGNPIQGKASPIELPETPVYPTIKAEALACITDQTYEALNVRRARCESRVKTLENAIKAHNKSLE